jgi:hypothetical protein
MTLSLRNNTVPGVLLVASCVWVALTFFPLLYSFASPNGELQHLRRSLEGREIPRQELTSLVQGILDSSGTLKRCIRVSAYKGVSAEYKQNKSHTSKETEYAYVTWFEKRTGPTVLVLNLTEIDGSLLRFQVRESTFSGLAPILLLPLLAMALTAYWFLRRRRARSKLANSD